MTHISINIQKTTCLRCIAFSINKFRHDFIFKDNAPSLSTRIPSPTVEQFSAVYSSPKEQGELNRFKVTCIIFIDLGIMVT